MKMINSKAAYDETVILGGDFGCLEDIEEVSGEHGFTSIYSM